MRPMKSLCPPLVVLLMFATVATADDTATIKKLIPAASAMSEKDFLAIAEGRTLKLSNYKNKSLTLLVVFGTKIVPGVSDKAKQQFKFIFKDGVPSPINLVEEIRRETKIDKRSIVLGPITMIHAERITDFTCKVDGDRASGTVSFKVKNLYQGKVDYVAKRDNDKWQIVQFVMPARDILITRGDDGKWKKD